MTDLVFKAPHSVTTLIRPMLPSDRDFVISGWSSSYRTSHQAGMISMANYADVMHREVKLVLDHPTTVTLVAEEPGEFDEEGRPFLYGFISLRPPSYVYYVYVKNPYRQGRKRHGMRAGIATQLFEAANVDPLRAFTYACDTSYCTNLARKIPLARCNPLPARYLHEQSSARTEQQQDRAGLRHPRSSTRV